MSYAGKIEELIAERDELRSTLMVVSDSLDYLHGMTPEQAAAVRKDAERYRKLRDKGAALGLRGIFSLMPSEWDEAIDFA